MKRLKIVSLILAICMVLGMVAGCAGEPKDPSTPVEPEEPTILGTLDAPQNVTIDRDGLISWDPVEHATEYFVVINVGGTTSTHTVTNTSFVAPSTAQDFRVAVTAKAEGYNDSLSGRAEFKASVLSISAAKLRSGKTTTLEARLDGKLSPATWEIIEGGEYATITPAGVLTAKEVEQDTRITVQATSTQNTGIYTTRTFTILAKPELTAEMVSALANETHIEFGGQLTVDCYNIGISDEYYDTFLFDMTAAMDGTNWYAEYYDGNLGTTQFLYGKNVDGIASNVRLSYMNTEEYVPMLDANEQEITWEASGLYNNFKGLTLANFTFDEEEWAWKYVSTGNSDTLMQRMIDSACPYEFDPISLALEIAGGEIVGIVMKSDWSRSVVPGYNSLQTFEAVLNTGAENVEVPTITKYGTDEDHHPALNEALANMRALTSYTTKFRGIFQSLGSSSLSIEGYVETVTPEVCLFEEYTSTAGQSSYIDTFTGSYYGFKKFSEDVYNSFTGDKERPTAAARAFSGDFKNAKPSFEFAAELFRSYATSSDGSTTYFVDDAMNSVASLFYQSLGSDMQLYGMFATRGYTSQTSSFTPNVTMKEVNGTKYITEAQFFFSAGMLQGVIELEYSDFNTATIPAEKQDMITFTQREVPDAWRDFEITEQADEERVVNAADYLISFLGLSSDEELAQALPFFGTVLGDTFGFGMTSYLAPGGTNKLQPCVILYYDVLLDQDYTITSSLRKAEKLLRDNGFERNAHGEYVKNGVKVQVVDSSLDFNIYIWKESAPAQS